MPPTISHLLSMSGTLVRRTETVTSAGDVEVTEDAGSLVPCYLERQSVTELREGENVAIAQWRGYFDIAFPGTAGDLVISPTGLRLELVGQPEQAWNARLGAISHLEARLREAS